MDRELLPVGISLLAPTTNSIGLGLSNAGSIGITVPPPLSPCASNLYLPQSHKR